MANVPPFVVQCAIPASGSSRRVDIQLICQPDDEEPPEESLYTASEEAVDLFAAAVNSQLWYPTASAEEQAQLRIVNRSWVTMPAGWLFQCELDRVAPQSFLALLALLTQTHYSYEPLAEVRIRGVDTRTLDSEQLLTMKEQLLRLPPGLPFPVSDERWDGAKGLELGFEFSGRLSANLFDEFTEALGIWDALRLLGGFQLDFSERALSSPGRTVWIGPQTAEHSVTEFPEDGAAVPALLSLVRWQHIRGMPLSSLTIG